MLHPKAPDLAGAHSGKPATDRSAGAGWIAGFGARTGAYRRQDDSRLAGGVRQNAPPRSGETSGKGYRLSGRQGRHARGRPVLGSRRRRKGHSPRPSAGGQAARALAQARAPTRARSLAASWLACGPHNAGRMQTCEQTGRWMGENGTGHGQRHHAPHGHGQVMDMAPRHGTLASLVFLWDTHFADAACLSSLPSSTRARSPRDLRLLGRRLLCGLHLPALGPSPPPWLQQRLPWQPSRAPAAPAAWPQPPPSQPHDWATASNRQGGSRAGTSARGAMRVATASHFRSTLMFVDGPRRTPEFADGQYRTVFGDTFVDGFCKLQKRKRCQMCGRCIGVCGRPEFADGQLLFIFPQIFLSSK